MTPMRGQGLIGVAARTVLRDWRRSAATALTVVLAVTAFVVLTASAQTSQLVTTGTVNSNYRASYDILVRPVGSRTTQEQATARVRPNYLSGLFGGITLAQVEKVKAIPGVDVAAPVAMVGEVFQTVDLTVDVTDLVAATGPSLLRVTSSVASMRGLAKTPGGSGYVYVGDHVALSMSGDAPSVQQTLPDGRSVPVCAEPAVSATSPFDPAATFSPQCWDRSSGESGERWPGKSGQFLARVPVSFPVMLAAVDPDAENRLTGLNAAIVSGSPLRASDGILPGDAEGRFKVPVLTTSTTFVDETTSIRVEKLPLSAASTMQAGATFEQARTLVASAAGAPGDSASFTAQQAHDVWRQDRGPAAGTIYPRMLFQPSSVAYTGTPGASLSPKPVAVAPSTWSVVGLLGEPFAAVPPTAADTGYRSITSIPALGGLKVGLSKVGTFDPTKLTQQSALSEVPLETYQPPVADPADQTSEGLLKGPLRPDTNPAGYLQSPPMLLTTMAALLAFSDSSNFALPAGSHLKDAPVSAVRVRVDGVTGADSVSRERVRLAAERIQAATGLEVDVTAGSSPAPTEVSLPATAHGAPALNVSERWTQKGVAATIITAIDKKSLTLFVLILAATALAVAISAQAAVRARRTELGVLACIGWRPNTLLRHVLAELTLIGLVGGAGGAVLSWPVAHAMGIDIPPWRALLAIPAALLLVAAAGLVPAVLAGRSTPIAAVRPAVLARARRSLRLRGPFSLAVGYLLRTPGLALAGAASLALGITTLATLLGIAAGFQGAVVGTVLGDAISVQVRGPDIAAAVLLTVIGLASLADILYLDIREQGPRYAALQACGWRDRTLGMLILWQALAIGAAGSVIGAGLSLLLLAALTSVTPGLVGVTALVALAGVAAAIVVAIVPAVSLRRLPTAELLARD